MTSSKSKKAMALKRGHELLRKATPSAVIDCTLTDDESPVVTPRPSFIGKDSRQPVYKYTPLTPESNRKIGKHIRFHDEEDTVDVNDDNSAGPSSSKVLPRSPSSPKLRENYAYVKKTKMTTVITEQRRPGSPNGNHHEDSDDSDDLYTPPATPRQRIARYRKLNPQEPEAKERKRRPSEQIETQNEESDEDDRDPDPHSPSLRNPSKAIKRSKSIIPKHHLQVKKNHNKSKYAPKKATVEDEESEDKLARQGKPSLPELVNALENAHSALARIGNGEEVERYLKQSGLADTQGIQDLWDQCAKMSRVLQASAGSSFGSQVPSTIGLYDQKFMYRARNGELYLLGVVEAFRGNKRLKRNKVFGFVRLPGGWPLMTKLPGYFNCADDHPKLLDNSFWLREVRRWAKFHNHTFRPYVFEKCGGKKSGTHYASHVEPSLMLWFSCYMLKKLLKIDGTIRYLIGELYQLEKLKIEITAEIVLTRKPCPPCRAFQEVIERYTGIKFKCFVAPNLGALVFTKDKHGNMNVPPYAYDSETDADSEAEAEEHSETDGSESDIELAQPSPRSISQSRKKVVSVVSRQQEFTDVSRSAAKKPGRKSAASTKLQTDSYHTPAIVTQSKPRSRRPKWRDTVASNAAKDFRPSLQKSDKTAAEPTPDRSLRTRTSAAEKSYDDLADVFPLEALTKAQSMKSKKRTNGSLTPSFVPSKKAKFNC